MALIPFRTTSVRTDRIDVSSEPETVDSRLFETVWKDGIQSPIHVVADGERFRVLNGKARMAIVRQIRKRFPKRFYTVPVCVWNSDRDYQNVTR